MLHGHHFLPETVQFLAVHKALPGHLGPELGDKVLNGNGLQATEGLLKGLAGVFQGLDFAPKRFGGIMQSVEQTGAGGLNGLEVLNDRGVEFTHAHA